MEATFTCLSTACAPSLKYLPGTLYREKSQPTLISISWMGLCYSTRDQTNDQTKRAYTQIRTRITVSTTSTVVRKWLIRHTLSGMTYCAYERESLHRRDLGVAIELTSPVSHKHQLRYTGAADRALVAK